MKKQYYPFITKYASKGDLMKHPKLYHLPSKVSNDPMEDKLTLFRQQAAIIARKKESTAEKLNDVRVELAAIEDEVKEKKSGELLI